MPTLTGSVEFTGTGTLTSDPGGGTPTGQVSFVGATSFGVTPAPVGRRWRVVVTDVNGTTIGELPYAVLGSISFELNKAESWSFQLLQNDPGAALLFGTPFREIQVWRGDQLLAWGPVVRMAMDKDYFVVSCKGALWHLSRRNIGKADRTNWVDNGDFEEGALGWNFGYNPVLVAYGAPHAQAFPPTHEIVAFPTVTGRKAMRLQNTVDGCDAFANQSFEFTVNSETSPDGDIWTIKGYAYIDELIPEAAAAFQGRGLYMERFSTTQLNPDPLVQAVLPGAPLSLQHAFVALDEDIPVGMWTRMEVEFTTPPKAGEPEIIEVRLYAPAGVNVFWDAISLTLVEKLAFYGKDQTSEIAAGIVAHLQDLAYEKSDVNISLNCPSSGVLRTRVYIHSEHPGGLSALEEFTGLDNGFDFDVSYTPTERIFTTYYPQKGSLKSAYALQLGVNVADWTWSFDGENAASSVIVLGSGNGSDREEGFALDVSGWSDGVTLEKVIAAPPETNIDSLDNMAAEVLTASRNPVSLQVKTTPPQPDIPDLVGAVWPGDEVPVLIQRHALDIDGVYRIVALTINPDHSLDLTLNLHAERGIPT